MALKAIIKKPVITEKSLELANKGWLTFEVARKATKGQIKNAIESAFKVEVKEVKTLNVAKKPKRWGRVSGYTSGQRKAIIKLKKGTIDLFKVK